MADSLRIRFDGNRYRERAIERATEFYGVNKSDAVAYACNDVVGVVDALQKVLERDDLTIEQRREIAQEFDAVAQGLSVDVVDETNLSVGGSE